MKQIKTHLPEAIKTEAEARAYLLELYNNGEAYHPDDSVENICWQDGRYLSGEIAHQMNALMEQVCSIEGFDPYEFILNLNNSEDQPVKSVLDSHGRTEEFNMLQQMLWNFQAAHAWAIADKNELLRELFNDSISKVDHLLFVEQKRIEQMTGSKPDIIVRGGTIMQERIENDEHILDPDYNNELTQSHHDTDF